MSKASKVLSYPFGRAFAAAAVCAALLGAPATADEIEVPADFAVLQDAIDAASPGDTIVIDSGEYAAITVDKPLTLVGRGRAPVILAPEFPDGPLTTQPPNIDLVGPGSGIVTLSNLATGGETNGFFFSSTAAILSASGFDEVRVLHCDLEPPTWEFLSGFATSGKAGIFSTVPWLLVADSRVVGGQGGDDISGALEFDVPDGAPGIFSTGTVVLVDSEVRGGDGVDTLFASDFPSGCPVTCGDVDGGDAGYGVEAALLQLANSVVQGGQGAALSCLDVGGGGTSLICTKPGGDAIVAGTVVEQLPGTLFGSGPLTLGAPWSLTWSFAAPSGLLLVSLSPTPGVQIGLKGKLFMSPAPILMKTLPGGGLQNASFDIPADPALSGLTVAIQTFAPGDGLSRPVFGTLLDS